MSKKNYTHIITIVDESGSMNSIKNDMEGGFASFIDSQKQLEGEATLTLVGFSESATTKYENKSICNSPKMHLNPRGRTALLDAIGDTLSSERKRINMMDEDDRPEKIICIIITDGQENASHKYSRDQVFEMISNLEDNTDQQWDFVFLGANQDSIKEGGSIGISRTKSLNYDATPQGTQIMFSTLSRSISYYRSNDSKADYNISDYQ